MSPPGPTGDRPPSLAPLEQEETLTQRAYAAVRRAMLTGELENGELYSVQTLATMLNVSRTPVREALLQLERDGAVRFERNRGVRIIQAAPNDIEDVFIIRLLLEVPATYVATTNSQAWLARDLRRSYDAMLTAAERGNDVGLWQYDQQFHSTLMTASEAPRLVHLVQAQRDFVVQRTVTTEQSRSLTDIACAHEPILIAVEAKDAVRAATAMWNHLRITASLLLRQVHSPTDKIERWAVTAWNAIPGASDLNGAPEAMGPPESRPDTVNRGTTDSGHKQ